MGLSNYGSAEHYNKHRRLEFYNPTSICNKCWVYLLYITNFDDILGYSQPYVCTIIINDDCSRLSQVWPTVQFLAVFEKSEWSCRIEPQVWIYLFNYLAQYIFAFYYYITFLLHVIWIYLNFTLFFPQILIHIIYYLPPWLMFLCCLLVSNPAHLFRDADTLPLGYWSLWSSTNILYIRYKYVPIIIFE